jgi:heterodisulfide reductase subunit B2
MRYGLFLGCNMPAIRPDVERAIRLTMPELGVELVDLDGYVCCPAFGTFPSMDEEAQLAVNAWNMSLGEERGVDLLIECGSCYSSLRTGRALLAKHEAQQARVNELLAKSNRSYAGKAVPRHITDVLYNEVGLERIASSVKRPLEGLHGVIQYPCHTLFPSDIVGFEASSARPRALAALVEALGATVDHFSLEYQCCGGAGGFHRASKIEAQEFTRKKLDAIVEETQADFIAVSCITCLMFLDQVQADLSEEGRRYEIPVFDYNQLLALCMGFPKEQVASISATPRDRVTSKLA